MTTLRKIAVLSMLVVLEAQAFEVEHENPPKFRHADILITPNPKYNAVTENFWDKEDWTLPKVPLLRRKWAHTFAVDNDQLKDYIKALRALAESMGFKPDAIVVDGPMNLQGDSLTVKVSLKRSYLPKDRKMKDVLEQSEEKRSSFVFGTPPQPPPVGSSVWINSGLYMPVPADSPEIPLFTANFVEAPISIPEPTADPASRGRP